MDFTETSVCSSYSPHSMRTTVPKIVVQGLKINNKDKLVWHLKSTTDGGYSLTVDVEHQK